MHAQSLQQSPTLWDPTGCSPLGSSVHGTLRYSCQGEKCKSKSQWGATSNPLDMAKFFRKTKICTGEDAEKPQHLYIADRKVKLCSCLEIRLVVFQQVKLRVNVYSRNSTPRDIFKRIKDTVTWKFEYTEPFIKDKMWKQPITSINGWMNKMHYLSIYPHNEMGLFWWLDGKESACNAGEPGSMPVLGNPLEKEMATPSSIFAWRIPRTIEFRGL